MSVEFEPVKLAPRRRRVDPVFVGAIAVLVAMVAALIKPWETGGAVADASPGTPRVAAADAATPAISAAPDPRESFVTRVLPGYGEVLETLPVPTWPLVAPVLTSRHEWGIRAIAVDQEVQAADLSHESPGYAERWFRLTDLPDGIRAAFVESINQPIVALGLTFPPDETPIDARIWRVLADDRLEWLDARPIDAVPSGGAFLFVPPAGEGDSIRSWGAGRYRIDVLVAGAIERISVSIPGRFGIVPPPRPASEPDSTLPDPRDADLEDLPEGLFATMDGVGIPLSTTAEPSTGVLDEAAAWLDADPGTGRAPRSRVATAYLPRATGLGVMLPADAVVRAASVERLAPGVQVDGSAPVGGGLFDHRDDVPFAIFAAPNGGAWTPGVYAISVTWVRDLVVDTGTWYVELRPGPVQEVPRLLAAVRGWSRHAGASGLILGAAEPLEGGPRSATIGVVTLAFADGTVFPADNGLGCEGPAIEGRPGLIGVAYAPEAIPPPVTVRAIFPGGRSYEQPLLDTGAVVPGLRILAPADRLELAPATYRITFGTGIFAQRITVCVGSTPFEG